MNEKLIWDILGIEKTDDVEAIREAYRLKLVSTNPEDDQEGFMALKEAYDEAIRIAEAGSEEEEEELSELMSRIDDIYKDISKRTDINYWNELFSAPEFDSIDEQEAIRTDFLNYAMENSKYPVYVWKKIDQVMSIVQDAEALKEQYPKDYVDFLVESVNDGNYILDEQVVVGRKNGNNDINDYVIETDQAPSEARKFKYEVDEYISMLQKFYAEFETIDNMNVPPETRTALIDRLGADLLFVRKYDFYHCFEELALIKYLYYKESYVECFGLVSKAVDRILSGEHHADYYNSHIMFMYLRFFVQDSHKNMEISDKTISISEDKLKKCKEIIPKTNKVIYINENHAVLSLCSYLEGDKKTAYDYIAYMLNYHRNSSVYELINKQIEHDRLEELPGMIEADPENNSLKISLAWIYSRNERLEEGYQLIKDLNPGDDEILMYDYFIGTYFMRQNQFEEAISYMTKFKDELCKRYDPDADYNLDDYSIADVRNILRIPYTYYILGALYLNINDTDNAKENVLKALKYNLDSDYYEYANLYDAVLAMRKEYEEGVDFWTKEIEKENEYIAICHGNRQYMAFKAYYAREVIEDYFYLRYNDPKYADSYYRAESIYLDYNDFEGFETCLEFIKENDVKDIRLDFNYAKYLRAKKNYDEALEKFNLLEGSIDEDSSMFELPSEFYVSYGYCMMDKKSQDPEYISEEDFKEKLLSLIDKAKKCDDGNINPYWLDVDFRERYDSGYDLKPLYMEMLEKFPNNGTVDYEIGMIYKKEEDTDKAGAYFESGFKKSPRNVNLHYELSDYYNDYRFRELEEAEYSEKAIAVAESLINLRYDERSAVQYALILIDGMEYDKAMEFLNKAVEDFPDDPYVINARGLIYMRTERYEEAEADFRKAIDVYKGKNGFAAFTNLANLFEKQNRFDEAVAEYKNYMERFDKHGLRFYNRLADLYDRSADYKGAIEARVNSIRQKIEEITGEKCDYDIEFSVCKIADRYPNIPDEKFLNLIDYMYDIATSYSIADRVDEMYKIEAENMAFIDRINLFRDINDLPDDIQDDFLDAIWSVGHYHIFTDRNPEIAARYYEKYVSMDVRKKYNSDIKYYDNICQAYDLLGRVYMFMGNAEKAAEAGRKALECIEKSHGSIDNYINFKRYRPLYLSRLSGIYLAMGEKEKAFECLDMIDGCKKCSHCSYFFCVDKTDRLALYAELDGDYEKAIEIYEYGKENSGYENEKICGIRECRKHLS